VKRPEDMARDDLEAEVVYLRSELGLMRDDDDLAALRQAYPMPRSAARLVLALRAAGQRGLTYQQLDDALPQVRGAEGERQLKVFSVWAHYARKALGFDAVETIWGRGFRISPQGAARVDAALNTQHKRSA
jgi:hypothetical protein